MTHRSFASESQTKPRKNITIAAGDQGDYRDVSERFYSKGKTKQCYILSLAGGL